MNGLASSAALGFLRGAVLLYVGIGGNEVILDLYPPEPFSSRICIQTYRDAELEQPSGVTSHFEDAVEFGRAVTDLLDSPIVDCDITPPGTLELRFENEVKVRLFDSVPDYESYIIEYEGQMTVV